MSWYSSSVVKAIKGFDDLVDKAVHGLGSVAGVSVYYTAKRACEILNVDKHKLPIYKDTAKRLGRIFPGMKFSGVRVVKEAILPANLFNSSIAGMTFDDTIYLSRKDAQYDYQGFLVLIHETVHVKQIQSMGEATFATKYGQQFVDCGGYNDKMPLENEAYSLGRKIVSRTFNPDYYLRSQLSDCLSKTDPIWEMRAFAHYLDVGIEQGLQSHPEFCVKQYLEKYPDLLAAFGSNNYPAAFHHWLAYGIDEGRLGY